MEQKLEKLRELTELFKLNIKQYKKNSNDIGDFFKKMEEKVI